MKRKLHLSFGRRGVERDVDSEIRFHIEMRTQELIAAGMDPEEARRTAKTAFGDLDRIAGELRDVRRRRQRSRRLSEAAADLGGDIRNSVRSLRRSPGYAAAVLLTLALGIGANTAVFSLINGVLLRPLPYKRGERLVQLHQPVAAADLEDDAFSPPELADYRRASESFERLVEYHGMYFTLLGLDEPVRVQAGVVSADFFDLLGIEPYIGRTFRPGEDQPGADPVLVLSYPFWKGTLKGDPTVLGRKLEMNDRPHTVVGVLPPIPGYPDENDVYMPVSACPFRPGWDGDRTARALSVFGRLKPGVDLASARDELASIAADLHEEHPEAYDPALEYSTVAAPLEDLLVRRARPRLLILLAISGLLLLIACSNVANLTLARLLRGEREMAIRAALGAGRGRLLRKTMLECSMLSLLGGGAGLLLAFGGLGLLKGFVAHFTARAVEAGIDTNVLLFTVALSLTTGFVLGILPALPARGNPMDELRESSAPATASHSRMRARKALIVVQVALSFALLVGAGLLIRSFMKLQRVDPGFDTESVVSAAVNLDWTNYRESEPILKFVRQLEERIEAAPGVMSVAVAGGIPLRQAEPYLHEVTVRDGASRADNGAWASYQVVSADYFRTMKISWLEGGTFASAWDAGAVPVVINRTLARALFGDGSPLGRQICWHACEEPVSIVGVVADVKQYGLSSAAVGEVYLPFDVEAWSGFYLLVRTNGDARGLESRIRGAVKDIDPAQPVIEVRTLEQYRNSSIAGPRLASLLLGIFAAVALLITAAGIGGIIAYSVGQRTRDIGIRIALGANPGGVVRMVVRQALALVVLGLTLGVPAALVLGHGLSQLLFEVPIHDPITFASVIALLDLVALGACYAPARRAIRIDPISTLRTE
jgi:putative ABC transport system permease protein